MKRTKVLIDVMGMTIKLEEKGGKFIKPDVFKLLSGYNTNLKPSHEVILCFWKPRESTFAKNALKWGVAGLNIDGCRIGTEADLNPLDYDDTRRTAPKFSGVYNNGKEGQYRARTGAVPSGRYPANILLSHHPDCVRVGVKQVRGNERPNCVGKEYSQKGYVYDNGHKDYPYRLRAADPDGLETVPDYRCHPDCPVRALDQQAGERPVSGSAKNGRPATGNDYDKNNTVFRGLGSRQGRLHNDSGSASRFFYCPKAPGREKWFYCQICDDCYPYAERDDHAHGKPKGKRKHQIAHPTVKPVTICNHLFGVLEYLCRLTKTPTGGIVLDPFGGSGTTALAAIANGRDFILIENDPIYHKIAAKRITKAKENPKQLKLL